LPAFTENVADSDAVVLVLAVLGLILVLFAVGPLLLLWCIYTILGMPIQLSLERYVAALLLILFFGVSFLKSK